MHIKDRLPARNLQVSSKMSLAKLPGEQSDLRRSQELQSGEGCRSRRGLDPFVDGRTGRKQANPVSPRHGGAKALFQKLDPKTRRREPSASGCEAKTRPSGLQGFIQASGQCFWGFNTCGFRPPSPTRFCMLRKLALGSTFLSPARGSRSVLQPFCSPCSVSCFVALRGFSLACLRL